MIKLLTTYMLEVTKLTGPLFFLMEERKPNILYFLIFGVHVIYMLDGNNERQRKEKIVLVKL